MKRNVLELMVASVVALGCCGQAKAQWGNIPMPAWGNLEMPSWDINRLAAQNIAFSQMMDRKAQRDAWDIARSLPPGTRVQVNPHAADGYRTASENYIRGMQDNSRRTSNAIGRWDQAALRGEWAYGNGGTAFMLPNTFDGYTVNPQTYQINPGWTGNGTYLYPLSQW